MAANFTFISSPKVGHSKLVYKNFTYNKGSGANTEQITYRCALNQANGYNGAVLLKGELFYEHKPHTHLADHINVATQTLKRSLYDYATIFSDKPRSILAKSLVGVPDQILAMLPPKSTLSQNISRIKRKSDDVDLVIHKHAKADDLILSLKDTQLHDGTNFLYFDSKTSMSLATDTKRILIFATNENINLLRTLTAAAIDGTFGSAPSQLYQMVVIRGN
uniref:FLYWCH-type domain-containing protein n=1 Tax=Rhabditophanes sp. KR3021 TaxID=114890 RepID=A0AC35UDL5_9BILA